MRNTGRLLKMASNHLIKQLNDFAKKLGLTWNQMTLIDYLSGCQPCTQRDIEKEFCIQRPTASIMIQRMEKKGLVTRTTDNVDARQRNISLTKQATPLIGEVHDFLLTQQKQLEKNFKNCEIETFEKILKFIINDSHTYDKEKREDE